MTKREAMRIAKNIVEIARFQWESGKQTDSLTQILIEKIALALQMTNWPK